MSSSLVLENLNPVCAVYCVRVAFVFCFVLFFFF